MTCSIRALTVRAIRIKTIIEDAKEMKMARKLCKTTISALMGYWGRKGGSRATQKQKDAARNNLKKTPNYRKHVERQMTERTE
jgi:hypothetical protein